MSCYSLCAPSVKSVGTGAPHHCSLRASALAVALLLAASHGHAESNFTDPEDGAFDLSNLLLTHSGVLPVPTLITLPAVGNGLGLGLLYFSSPKKSADASDASKAPPNDPPVCDSLPFWCGKTEQAETRTTAKAMPDRRSVRIMNASSKSVGRTSNERRSNRVERLLHPSRLRQVVMH